MALGRKAEALVRVGRYKEAIAACDELDARARDATNPQTRCHVGRALLNKGAGLTEIGRLTEAIWAFEDIAARTRWAGSVVDLRVRSNPITIVVTE